jgi:hypothetical protein
MTLNLKICRERSGTWSLDGLPAPVFGLPSLSATIDYARRECAAAPATIELIVDGVYMVVHQERGWPRRLLESETDRQAPLSDDSPPDGEGVTSRLFAWLKGGIFVRPCKSCQSTFPHPRRGSAKQASRRPRRSANLPANLYAVFTYFNSDTYRFLMACGHLMTLKQYCAGADSAGAHRDLCGLGSRYRSAGLRYWQVEVARRLAMGLRGSVHARFLDDRLWRRLFRRGDPLCARLRENVRRRCCSTMSSAR